MCVGVLVGVGVFVFFSRGRGFMWGNELPIVFSHEQQKSKTVIIARIRLC